VNSPQSSVLDPHSRIYVAGHRGLVGSAIVRKLLDAGLAPQSLLLKTHPELDLRSQQSVDAFFADERPDYVFLAAARVGGIHANSSYPADFIRDNIQIQTNVIDAAWRNSTKKLLFLGSSCIYPKMAPQPLREESLLTGPLEPTNEWYAMAKIAGIKMCQAYRRQYGFNAISLMPTNLYGPNDNFDLETSHVLPAMIRKFYLAKLAGAGNVEAIMRDEARFGLIPDDILSALGLEQVTNSKSQITGRRLRLTPHACPKVILWGTGSPRREFLHVDNLADACLFFMNKDSSFLGTQSSDLLFNIGVGEDITIRELAEMIQKIAGFEGEVIWDGSKPDGTPRKLLNVSRLHELGWQPQTTLADGIAGVYHWYQGSIHSHRETCGL